MTTTGVLRDKLAAALPQGSLRRRLASGVFWSVVGAVAVQLAGAAGSILVARILGQDAFGDFGVVRNTVMMLGVFAGLGLGMTANKYVAEYRATDRAKAGRILALCLVLGGIVGSIMSALVFLYADILASRHLHAPQLGHLIRICAPLLLLNTINSVQAAGISGLESFRHLSICSSLNALILAIVTTLGAYVAGIDGAVWGSVVAVTVTCIILEIVSEFLRRKHGVRLVFKAIWSESKIIAHFAFPSFLSSVLYQPTTWLVIVMLYTQLGGRGEVAIFSASSQWRNVVLFVPAALGQVVLPMLTNLWSTGSNRGYVRTLQVHSLASLVIGLAAAIPISIASPWILATYGPGFVEGWWAMSLLALSAVLQAVCNVIGQSLASLGRMWWALLLNFLWAVELYISARVLIGLGATGLAAAFLIAYLLHTIQVGAFTYFDLKHSIGIGGSSTQQTQREADAVE